jgi:hypothetical protein
MKKMEELLLFLAFVLGMGISPWPNAFICAGKFRKLYKMMNIPTKSKPITWYEAWAFGVLESNHSVAYQALAFLTPVAIFLLGIIVWFIGQFPSWSWIPVLFGLLAAHMIPTLYYRLEVRHIKRTETPPIK